MRDTASLPSMGAHFLVALPAGAADVGAGGAATALAATLRASPDGLASPRPGAGAALQRTPGSMARRLRGGYGVGGWEGGAGQGA